MKVIIRLLLVCALFVSCKEEKTAGHFGSSDTLVKQPGPKSPVSSLKTNWDVLLIKEIDSAEFYSIRAKVSPAKEEYTAITDRKLANRMLRGVVSFADYDGDTNTLVTSDSGWVVTRIKPRRGNIITFDKNNEPGFTAYYPELDILLCEAGHQTEVSFNLTTGDSTENTGNPAEFVTSADKTMRLNGSYDGQECNGYFIQVKEKGQYRSAIKLYEVFENRMPKSIGICQIADAFWEGNTTLYIREAITSPNVYYKVVLVER